MTTIAEQFLQFITDSGALVRDHVVLTSGRHSNIYLNKSLLQTRPVEFERTARDLADQFESSQIDVVVAPAVGAIALGQAVACALSSSDWDYIYSLYLEKEPDGSFRFTRGLGDLIQPKHRVLVIEDVLTTGGSAIKVVAAVKQTGATVMGIGALCNRGGVTADSLGVPRLVTLLDLPSESWLADKCPLCRQGHPINTTVGKGREFLAKTT